MESHKIFGCERRLHACGTIVHRCSKGKTHISTLFLKFASDKNGDVEKSYTLLRMVALTRGNEIVLDCSFAFCILQCVRIHWEVIADLCTGTLPSEHLPAAHYL